MLVLRWPLLVLFVLTMRASLAQDDPRVVEADTLVAHGEWKAARKLCAEVIAGGNAPADAYFLRAICSNRLLMDRDQVLEDLAEALRKEPHHFRTLVMRARLYYYKQMFDRSADDLSDALAHAPDTAGLVLCHTERGSALCAQHKMEPAIADFRRALELDSTAYSAYGRLADVLFDMGLHEEALAMQLRYIERVPDDYTGPMNMGFCLAELERFEEALSCYDKAWPLAKEDFDKAYVLNNRGYIHYKLGDLRAASKDVRASLKLKPSNAYAHRNLALVLLAQGRNDEACTALEDALSWDFTKLYGDEVKQLYAAHCH